MSFQRDHAILVASVAAYDRPPASSAALVESCRRQGIELTTLGQGQPYASHRIKTRVVAEHLRAHPEHRYVLQLDFRDVLWCATLREAFTKFRAFGRAIVASAERHCWPMPRHAALSPDLGTTARYLNSGAIFAEAAAWLDAWDRMCAKERRAGGEPPELGLAGRHIFDDDQAAWGDLYVHGEADIALDARSEIFQSLARVDRRFDAANRDLRFEGRRVINRESEARPCLVHCNGQVPIAPWARYILEPPVAWAGPLLDRLRAEPFSALGDPARVERLVLDLGLDDPGDDVPISLLPYSGKGLGIRRRPAEFAAFLAWLAGRPPVRSYVEIGVGSGGAFLATVGFLRRLGPLDLALAIDAEIPPLLLDDASRPPTARLVRAPRADATLGAIAEAGGHVDLALIDARIADDARAAWLAARSCARLVALHGIAAGGPPGVAALWAEIRAAHGRAWEFVDPRLPPASRLGLGVVDLAAGPA